MKAIFSLFIFLLMIIGLNAQRGNNSKGPQIDWTFLTKLKVNQSTIKNEKSPRLAIDGIKVIDGSYINSTNGNYSETYYGNFPISTGENESEVDINTFPFWEIDLGEWYYIDHVAISTPQPYNNYYILLSSVDFRSYSFADILDDDAVSYYHITSELPQNTPFPTGISTPVRFIRIQSDSYDNPIKLSEFDIFGDIFGTDNPFDGPGDIFGENCSDGIDNDGDGLIDCDDWPCRVSDFNYTYTEPSCPICEDAEICFDSGIGFEVSLDGGSSYTNIQGPYCFSNLSQGTYDPIIISRYGCEYNELTIDLFPPIGIRNSLCGNGDLEDGEYTDWTGGIGTNSNSILSPIFNFDNSTIVPGRHDILGTATFVDPFVPQIINGNFTPLGSYVARLGNVQTGAETERLTFCFDVTEENADFSFWYAMVMQNPGHGESDDPYFAYRIYPKGDYNNPILVEQTSSSEEFLETLEEQPSIRFKPFTCSNTDLSNFVGQEVCVEFVTADCTEGGHFAYAYIDGLCSDVSVSPTIALQPDDIEIYCDNQVITVKGVGLGFNRYKWSIRESLDGVNVNSVESEIMIGSAPCIEDLQVYYSELSGVELSCGSELQVTLEVFNDCSSMNSVTGIYDIICEEITVAYCNPQINCSATNNEIQILGINDCDDCDIVWSPSNTLSDPNAKFPIVSGQNFANAFSKDYTVTVTTPEGCVYEQTVSIEQNAAIVSVTNDISACTFRANGTVDLLMEIPNENLVVTIYDDPNFQDVFEVLQPTGTGLTRFFQTVHLRDTDHQFYYKLSVEGFGDNCVQGSCQNYFTGDEVVSSNYAAYWRAFYPNVFSPNGDGINDVWNFIFRSTDEDFSNSGCDGPRNEFLSSVTKVEIDIFDEWGGAVFSRILEVDPLVDFDGILGDEPILTWDGNHNNEPAIIESYTFIAKISSCYGVLNSNCPNPSNAQGVFNAQGGGSETISGSIQIIR